MEESERRGFAVLAGGGDDLGWAASGEEDGRRELIEAAHPEFASALDSGVHEVIVGGQLVNAALHVSLHEIVVSQLWNDDPAELWQTAVRLTALGYDRHDVLHMLMDAVGEDVRRALTGEAKREQAAITRALVELPESWERRRPASAPVPAANRAARRAAARRR